VPEPEPIEGSKKECCNILYVSAPSRSSYGLFKKQISLTGNTVSDGLPQTNNAVYRAMQPVPSSYCIYQNLQETSENGDSSLRWVLDFCDKIVKRPQTMSLMYSEDIDKCPDEANQWSCGTSTLETENVPDTTIKVECFN